MIQPDLHTWLKTHPVHSFPKNPDSFWLGRWHEHRLRLDGVKIEVLKHIKSRLKPRTDPTKVIVFGRPRSGTTLFGKLLAQVPGMHDEEEYLHYGHIDPFRSLEACAHSTKCDTFVAKLLSYQMLEVQQISDGYGFFKQLEASGYRFIHIRRNSFNQTLSLCTAQATGKYFVNDAQAAEAGWQVSIAPQVFVEELRRNLMMLAYEDLLMSGFPHLPLQYETDLESADAHQSTIDQVCAAVKTETAPVEASLPRTGGKHGAFKIANRSELVQAAIDAGLEHALSDHAPRGIKPSSRSQRGFAKSVLAAAS